MTKNLRNEVSNIEKVGLDSTRSIKPNPSTPLFGLTSRTPSNESEVSKLDEIRNRGVQECVSKGTQERQEQNMNEQKTLLQFLRTQFKIVDMKSIGQRNQNRDRTSVHSGTINLSGTHHDLCWGTTLLRGKTLRPLGTQP